MKTKKVKGQRSVTVDGKLGRSQLIAKAAVAEKLAETARQHWRALKLDQKHARKAFKQAKKAAKLARKEAMVGLKALKAFARKMAKSNMLKKHKSARAKRRVAAGPRRPQIPKQPSVPPSTGSAVVPPKGAV